MKAFVTGAAGFIGSNLTDRILERGDSVVGYDNLCTGHLRFLEKATPNSRFTLVRGDNLDLPALTAAMAGCDAVFHLAANADVRFGTQHPRKDLEQNTIATSNILEAMRANGIKRIAFSSTGSVYGEPEVFPTPEHAPFPFQTSLYGASKLAAEGLIQAYSTGFGFQGAIFRFVSILGPRYSHGHVFDFYRQLLAHPDHLDVLGDGTQRKSYLDVDDCVTAVLSVIDAKEDKLHTLNLGTDEYCAVTDSIGWISQKLGLSPKLNFAGGKRGWIGDSPFIFLDCTRMRSRGWAPKRSIRQGIERTLDYLVANPWVLEARS